MLNTLRRLLTRAPKPPDTSALAQWAERHGHGFRMAKQGAGCVVEGRLGTQAWRLEWGASQRDYIDGLELRLLADTSLPKDLVALVLNQQLAEVMERRVYEEFVDDVQTRIETQTPPEMRWLVMYSKLGAAELGPLRDRFTAVSGTRLWLEQWLGSPLGEALWAAQKVTNAEVPVALALHRSRLSLRIAMPESDMVRLTGWFAVFDHALREALRLRSDWQNDANTTTLSTMPDAWTPRAD